MSIGVPVLITLKKGGLFSHYKNVKMEEDRLENKDRGIKAGSDTLLVLNIHNNSIELVQGIDKEGNVKKLPPENSDAGTFIRIDSSGDLFSNFFSNFYSQLKNPTDFKFFKISEYEAVDTAKQLQEYVNEASPDEMEKLKKYELLPYLTKNQKNQYTMENTVNTENNQYRYQPEQIDWKTMEKLGLSQEKLEKMNALDPLLRGFKTSTLIPITINLGTAVSKMDVRLSLQAGDTGEVGVQLHGIRKEPNLNLKFFGHEFSQEDKKNLMETGNMGRIVNLVNPKTDEIIPSVISRDRLTNELVAYKAEYIKVPDEIKGIKLDGDQKQTLLEGKPLYLEGMISKKGEAFDATVQFNADKRYVEFIFNNNQNQGQGISKQNEEVPTRIFRGKELDDLQYERLKAGETVYVTGLTNEKGKEYQGYITFNTQTSKTEFSFTHPDKLKEKAEVSEAPQAQNKVNSDTKASETTKSDQEALEAKQQKPVKSKSQKI